MRSLHIRGVICVLCGHSGTLHHVYPKGQGGDDVYENLVGLCGDGTRGCHGLVENGDTGTRVLLGDYLVNERPDTINYVRNKLGWEEGTSWLSRRYGL